jgi:hypothetical protein
MRITGRIIINHGKIHYLDGFLELLEKLKKNPKAENKTGFVIIDLEEMEIRDYQRKYYWGYIIPPIAENSFGCNKDAAHIEMKRKFAYHVATHVAHIQAGHRNRAILEYRVYNQGEYVGIFRTMLHEGFAAPVLHKDLRFDLDGYLLSLSAMNKWEAAEYIKAVEAWAIDFLNIDIANDAPAYRDEALMIDKRAIKNKGGHHEGIEHSS